MSAWDMNDGSALTGTHTFTNGSAVVNGNASAVYLTEVKVGDVVTSAGGERLRVKDQHPARTVATSGVNDTSNVITFTAHGYLDGTAITYNAGGGTAMAGLTDGQIVLSGKNNDLSSLIEVLKMNTIKNVKLPVSAPFHCKLMNKATEKMKEEINKVNFKDGKNVLVSNVTANEISSKEELKRLLIDQIEKRVRWRESVINMVNKGVNHFIEIGPGKVLSGLVKRINKNVKINTINNESDIKDLKI